MKAQLPAIGKRTPSGTLSVVQHCLDVACCLEVLIDQPVFRCRVEAALGKELDPVSRERLAVLAMLHDAGKLSTGFQARIREISSKPFASHLSALVDLIVNHGNMAADLGVMGIERWGPASDPILATVLAHHGRPITMDDVPPDSWSREDWYDPAPEVRNFGSSMRLMFPLAFQEQAEFSFPPALQHLLTGFLTLADQIASRETSFPMDRWRLDRSETLSFAKIAVKAIGLDSLDLRKNLQSTTDGALFGWPEHFSLKPMQSMLRDLSLNTRLLLLEAETGSGKTEAAFLRFRRLFEAGLVDSLYFAVPTRSAAAQLHRRIDAAAKRLMGVEAVLAIPGMMRAGSAEGQSLPGFKVRWDDDPLDAQAEARWSAETGRRFLAAPIAVGTVDQVLLSGLQSKWAHMRGASLSRALLVVDEVHASDSYMQAVLKPALEAHVSLGGHALLMSATLGSHARAKLLGVRPGDRARDAGYPSISWKEAGAEAFTFPEATGRHKSVRMSRSSILQDPDAIARMVLEAAAQGGRILIIRNTVRAAREVYEAILRLDQEAPLLRLNGVPTLHHSRFAAEDRKRLDLAVEDALHPKAAQSPVIVIGTQTLEQSLDIDADLLLSDLCPIDVLLQRIGRLFRHDRTRPEAFLEPRCILLAPEEISPRNPQPAYGIGPSPGREFGGVYPNLLALETVLGLIAEHPIWEIPAMNRQLVEAGTDEDILRDRAGDLGEDWVAHLRRLWGADGAKRQQANFVILDRTRHFDFENGIFSPDGAPTRLGAGSLELVLEQPVQGPFGEFVKNFAVPDYLAKDADPRENVRFEFRDGKLFLINGAACFSYGASGLFLEL